MPWKTETMITERARFVFEAERAFLPFAELCRRHGISRPTGHSWLKRYRAYGLPMGIRSDNGTPFSSQALGGLSQLSGWWIKLGIIPELIEPGSPSRTAVMSGCTAPWKRHCPSS